MDARMDAPAPFRVEIATDGAFAEVVVQGELDIVTAAELEARCATVDPTLEVILDLSRVSFMDSTGLRALWAVRQRAAENGGKAILREPSSSVRLVLKTTKLDRVFDYAEA